MPEEQTTPEALMLEEYAQQLAKAHHEIIKLRADNQLLSAAIARQSEPLEGQVVN